MAAILVGHPMAVGGVITGVDTTQLNPLGMRVRTDDAKEFIYLAGVAAQVSGDWNTFNAATYIAIRLAADAVGLVAIAMGAVLAANWGWYQVYGFNTVSRSDTVAGAGGLFIDGTVGRVDDASVAGDFVNGAVSTGADTANVLPVHISYPYVTNTVPA